MPLAHVDHGGPGLEPGIRRLPQAMPAGVTDASLQAHALKQLVDRLCRSARLEHLAQGPWCQELAVAVIHQHHTGRLDW